MYNQTHLYTNTHRRTYTRIYASMRTRCVCVCTHIYIYIYQSIYHMAWLRFAGSTKCHVSFGKRQNVGFRQKKSLRQIPDIFSNLHKSSPPHTDKPLLGSKPTNCDHFTPPPPRSQGRRSSHTYALRVALISKRILSKSIKRAQFLPKQAPSRTYASC